MSEGKRKLTPRDVLDLDKAEAEESGLFERFNGSKTTVQRSVNEIDEGEA